jgi:hypothetical protein
MGTNTSRLFVKVPRVKLAAVEAAVVASYEARGCKVVSRAHEPGLEEQDEPPKKGRLGIALLPAGKSWITVVDSTRYLADGTLGRDLASRLGVTVFNECQVDTVGYRGLFRYGPVLSPRQAPGVLTEYRDVDEHPKGARYLVVGGVGAKTYARDDGPSCKTRCKCGYSLPWVPGYDVPCDPAPERLASFRGEAGPKRSGKLLVAMHCNECSASIGWAVARLDEGLIVSVEKLAKAPRDRAAFDLFLDEQRELVEAELPSQKTLEVKTRARSFAAAYEKDPRGALEGALAHVLPSLKQSKPPLLAWTFAPTREALVDAVKKASSAFAWKDVDLPGKLELQLVAWLGPKAKDPELKAFLQNVGALLREGSFARQGRHPETREWMTLVGFALPDGAWAGLRLFDQYWAAR